ncbi:MAG: M28 family peptidase, partial [Bacteroidota bacterium]
MKEIFLLVLLATTFNACSKEAKTIQVLPNDLPSNRAEVLQEIVGQLSGEYNLHDGLRLGSRWSKKERKLTRSYLKALISQLGIPALEHRYTTPNLHSSVDLLMEPYRGKNIYGILPATQEADEYLLLGAHYDTGRKGAPGAIDNATGIALIYRIVQELTVLKERKKHIVLVFFDQEEEELIGSKAFVTFLQKKRYNIHSAHCFDMVGWDEDGDRKMEIYTTNHWLMEVYQTVANESEVPLHTIAIDPVEHTSNATDFDAFVRGGYPVIGGGECYYLRDSTPFKDS